MNLDLNKKLEALRSELEEASLPKMPKSKKSSPAVKVIGVLGKLEALRSEMEEALKTKSKGLKKGAALPTPKQSKPEPIFLNIWKKVADMEPGEVVGEAMSQANGARMARQHKGGISSKDAMRFQQSMDRIEQESLADKRTIDDLWNQWRGQNGY